MDEALAEFTRYLREIAAALATLRLDNGFFHVAMEEARV